MALLSCSSFVYMSQAKCALLTIYPLNVYEYLLRRRVVEKGERDASSGAEGRGGDVRGLKWEVIQLSD